MEALKGQFDLMRLSSLERLGLLEAAFSPQEGVVFKLKCLVIIHTFPVLMSHLTGKFF